MARNPAFSPETSDALVGLRRALTVRTELPVVIARIHEAIKASQSAPKASGFIPDDLAQAIVQYASKMPDFWPEFIKQADGLDVHSILAPESRWSYDELTAFYQLIWKEKDKIGFQKGIQECFANPEECLPVAVDKGRWQGVMRSLNITLVTVLHELSHLKQDGGSVQDVDPAQDLVMRAVALYLAEVAGKSIPTVPESNTALERSAETAIHHLSQLGENRQAKIAAGFFAKDRVPTPFAIRIITWLFTMRAMRVLVRFIIQKKLPDRIFHSSMREVTRQKEAASLARANRPQSFGEDFFLDSDLDPEKENRTPASPLPFS